MLVNRPPWKRWTHNVFKRQTRKWMRLPDSGMRKHTSAAATTPSTRKKNADWKAFLKSIWSISVSHFHLVFIVYDLHSDLIWNNRRNIIYIRISIPNFKLSVQLVCTIVYYCCMNVFWNTGKYIATRAKKHKIHITNEWITCSYSFQRISVCFGFCFWYLVFFFVSFRQK